MTQQQKTARKLWTELDAERADVLARAESAAAFTLPYLMLPDGESSDKGDGQHKWQSVGAQMVNNLATRLMLTMFAPSRPFVRIDPSGPVEAAMQELNVSAEEIRQVLGNAEQESVKTLDRLAIRPKLFEVMNQLIVTGNVVLNRNRKKKTIRAINLRKFCVKRDIDGDLHTLVIKEWVKRDELRADLQGVARPQGNTGADDQFVDYFIVIRRRPGDKPTFDVTEWVEDTEVDTKVQALDDLEYIPLVWRLSDEANYGTSLVMDYEGDFAGMTQASEAIIIAAVLASEFRWLVSAASGTRPEDFNQSENGQAIPGEKDSVTLLNAATQVAAAMQAQDAVVTKYINRLGRAFVLPSSITRDAERVTAEEIRQLANELETGLGGAYSRLAVDLQLPLAKMLIDMIGVKINGKDYTVTIVTGLDALSRAGDLEQLKGWLNDIVTLQAAGPEVLRPLNLRAIYLDLATPRGVNASKYLKSEEQMKQEQDEESARAIAEQQQGEPNAR